MPCAPGDLGGVAGRLRFRRRFGYPGRIDAHERVWLVFEGLPASAEVRVNGVDLGTAEGRSEFDVTDLLQARNELAVDVSLSPGGGLWEEAALEVRRLAYLRGVRLTWQEGRIHAVGEVVGRSDGPLELYLIAGRGVAGYAPVTASEPGTWFDLAVSAGEQEGGPIDRVKIDLVQGASVWYTVEVTAPASGARGPGA
jgi:hypothetical protein